MAKKTFDDIPDDNKRSEGNSISCQENIRNNFINSILLHKIENFKDFFDTFLKEYFIDENDDREPIKLKSTVYYLGNHKFFKGDKYYVMRKGVEKNVITNLINIYVSTLGFLEKEGYITLLPANIRMVPIFKRENTIDGEILYLVKDYYSLKIVPNDLLKKYIDNDYRTPTEIRQKNEKYRKNMHLIITIAGAIIALLGIFHDDLKSFITQPTQADSLHVRITNPRDLIPQKYEDTLHIKVIEPTEYKTTKK